jgi:hypothetical protein
MDPFQLSPIGFPLFWIAMLFVLAQTGGWAELSEKYRCDHSFSGSCSGWQWAKIGSVNYKECLWIGISLEGLYIKTGPLFMFRAFHPPLLIPWSAIKSADERQYL